MEHEHHDHAEHHDQTEQHNHLDHHRMMIRDFQKRFYFTIVLSLPVLAISDLIQPFLGTVHFCRRDLSDILAQLNDRDGT